MKKSNKCVEAIFSEAAHFVPKLKFLSKTKHRWDQLEMLIELNLINIKEDLEMNGFWGHFVSNSYTTHVPFEVYFRWLLLMQFTLYCRNVSTTSIMAMGCR